jgi:cytochrome c oxidase cbb3-type subunit 2
LRFAQIIKFGIPDTDMPGHEYLSGNDISSISLWLNQTMILPHQAAGIDHKTGENP